MGSHIRSTARAFATMVIAVCALLSFPASGQQWRISSAQAEKIILELHPQVLKNAFLWGPREVPLAVDLGDFGDKGTIVWWLKIHCDNGGLHASFFVHADTGEVFTMMRPGEQHYSEKCVAR